MRFWGDPDQLLRRLVELGLKGKEMTRPWTQADLIRLKTMARQKASAAEIARSLGRRVASVKAKIREVGLVPLKKSRAKSPEAEPKS